MKHTFSFDEAKFNRLFPFYLLIDRGLRVIAAGRSIAKLLDLGEERQFNKLFSVERPYAPVGDIEDLVALENQLVVLGSTARAGVQLRGQFEFMRETGDVLFLGSPWFSSMEEVRESRLVLDDFARHDPLIDLLHVLKSQEITNDDLRQLLSTINKQKIDLQAAHKEVHDIALFPTQNPDPLIRIDFQGEILRNNPVAARLDFFEKDGTVYRNDEFFRLVARTIDKSEPRWIMEAKSGGKDYSFVCVSMADEGYINIYGRDITSQKKAENEIRRLSLVASANKNGVLYTTPDGRITWANEGFCRMTGYSVEEVMGRTPVELCQGPLTDADTLARVLESFHMGDSFTAEILYYRKDGSWFWGRSSSQPVTNLRGDVEEYFGIIEDITDEKTNQEKMRVLSQIAEDNINAVIIADREGKITWVNRSFVEMTGYTLDEVVGKKPGHLLQGPETDKKTVDYLRRQISRGESFGAEILNYDKAGNKYWLRISGQAIRADDGELTGFFALEENITREKESESRFRKVLENINDQVWERDLRTNQMYFSKSENEFLGMQTGPSTNGRELWWSCVLESDRYLLEEVDRHYKAGSFHAHSIEYRIRRADGAVKWVLDRGVVLEADRDGKPLRITGTHTDITEQKEAAQRLEAQRKFYEDILNNMPADIAVFSPRHEYLFVNPMGIRDPDVRRWIIGKRDEDYCLFRNKPLSIAEGRRRMFHAVVESRQPSEMEERVISPDGEEQFKLRRWYPVTDKEGNVTLVIGYGIDITERKKMEEALRVNEEKYRNIIANMNLGLMELDVDSKVTFANQSLLRMTGLSEEEVVGYDSLLLLAEESRGLVVEKRSSSGMERAEAFELETNLKGGKGWWLVSAAPKLDSSGGLSGFIVICLDITNQKKLERELIESKQQAELLVKARETFLANMSHEIRTPMNAVIGMSNQLARTDLSEKQQSYLGTIHTAAENLLVIINDILDISKIQAGKLSLEDIAFETAEVIAHPMQVLRVNAEEKGLKLTNSFCDPRLAPVLFGDPYRLNQVLLNLLSNAIKFTERGSVDMSCHVLEDGAEAQRVQVRIVDTGIGMDKEYVEKLFEKFSQEYESVSRKYGGTGLGMSICKELVELMGGRIQVSSEKGKGTTVQFEIMFRKGSRSDLPAAPSADVDMDFLKDKLILVADDNEMNRLVASTILGHYGVTVIEAENGEEALQAVRSGRPDLVLMDIQMPVMNGYEASRSIRASGQDIPIIAITANAIQGEKEKCLEAGMNDYLSKPYREEQLIGTMARWLAVGERRDEDPRLYDLSGLRDISRGNEDFVRKMLGLFMDQAPATMAEIREAYGAGDFDTVTRLAHRLKSSIDNLGIGAIKQEIREIESKAGLLGKSDKMDACLRKVESVLVKVVEELRAQLA